MNKQTAAKFKSFFSNRKIRVDILTIFLSLFLLTVALIIYYSYTRSSEAVIEVGSQLIERSNQAILEKLDNFFKPAPFVKVSNYIIDDQILSLSDMQSLNSYMHIILQSYPQLTNAYIADNNGNTFIEHRVSSDPNEWKLIPFIDTTHIPPNTRYISQALTHAQNNNSLEVQYKNENGDIIKSEKIEGVLYDATSRPWFIGAKKNPNEQWIGVYNFFGTKQPVISIAFAISEKNKIVGVAGADLDINQINQQLKSFSLTNNGEVIIVNNQGSIISSLNMLDTQNQKPGLPSIAQINNPLIKTAYDIYQDTHLKHFIFRFNHARYIANFTPYAFTATENWDVASIIPVDTFVGEIKQTNYQILIFSILMLIFGIVTIILSSLQISKPIIDLAHQTDDITHLKFDKKVEIHTSIYEIQLMQNALNAAKSALSSFSKYVPKALVEQLIKTKMIAQLGGEKRNITVMFCDIANFTNLAETMDPDALILHLSEYLNIMTQVIHENHGSIDKYIGDAIMAFWGAPLEDYNHLTHACDAVLALKKTVNELNKKWESEGKPIFPTRFGLNTGDTIVGNVGSSDRMNYTAIGDTVNLTSRLEALNKTYHSEIIASPAIYAKAHDDYLFRPLDIVHIRGKKHAMTVYELIEKNPAPGALIKLCQLSSEGFHAYHHQNVELAVKIFSDIAEKYPDDKMAQIYLKRCEELKK